MQIVHVTASLSRLGAGVSNVVWSMAAKQRALGEDVFVAGLRDVYTQEDCARAGLEVPFCAGVVIGSRCVGYSHSLWKGLCGFRSAHIVHNHGLWMWPGRQARVLALQQKAKLVISCHNMLDPVYLRRSRLKKCVAKLAYENRNLRAASCLHALGRQEVDAIRACGLDNPVAVIPNGIDVTCFADLPPKKTAGELWPGLRGKRIVLFLGRVHPVKGVANLIRAWGRIAAKFKDWHLAISGPDCGGHRAQIEDELCRSGLTERVTFTGGVYGPAKLAVLAAADVFILPSVSEGFSISVLEAMACRLPVLVTPQSGFQEFVSADAGRFVGTSPESIAEGLRYMFSLPECARVAMGERGHKLAAQKLSWTLVASQMLAVYRWLLSQGEKPECVIDN